MIRRRSSWVVSLALVVSAVSLIVSHSRETVLVFFGNFTPFVSTRATEIVHGESAPFLAHHQDFFLIDNGSMFPVGLESFLNAQVGLDAMTLVNESRLLISPAHTGAVSLPTGAKFLYQQQLYELGIVNNTVVELVEYAPWQACAQKVHTLDAASGQPDGSVYFSVSSIQVIWQSPPILARPGGIYKCYPNGHVEPHIDLSIYGVGDVDALHVGNFTMFSPSPDPFMFIPGQSPVHLRDSNAYLLFVNGSVNVFEIVDGIDAGVNNGIDALFLFEEEIN